MIENEGKPGPTRSDWFDLLLFLVVGFGSFFLLSLLLAQLIPDVTETAVYLLYLVNVLCFAGTFYLLGIRRGKVTWEMVGIRPFRWQWDWVLLGVGVAVVLLPVRGLIGMAVQMLAAGNLDSIQARSDLIMGTELSLTAFATTLLGVGILVPIAEELYFRGLIHTWFWQKVPRLWVRVLASGLIFALGHADSIGVVAASFVIGIVSPIYYERTKSLAVPIIIHITTNSTATVLLFVALAIMEYLPELT